MQSNQKLEWNRKQIAKCWQSHMNRYTTPPMNTEITGAPKPWHKVISWTFIGLALFQIIDPLKALRHARNKDNSCLMVMADCTLISKLSIISYGLNPCTKFLMNSSLLGTKKEAEVSHQLTGVFGCHFWSWCGLVVVRMGTDELHRQSKLPVLSKSSCCVESNMVCIGCPVKCHRNLLQRLRHCDSSLQAHTKTGTSEKKLQ